MNSKYEVIRQDPDHIWVNTTYYNNADYDVLARYNSFFSQPIVKNPSEWNMSIVRFRCPNNLQYFDFEDFEYWVTLSYGGLDYSVQLIQVREDYSVATDYSDGVYYLSFFIQSLNTALSTAFTNLKAANPGAPPASAPYFIYTASTKLFSLKGVEAYDPTIAGAPTIEIWFNHSLFSRFATMPIFYYGVDLASHKDVRLPLVDRYNNRSGGIITQDEEGQSLSTFHDLQSIIFTTNSIPTISEFSPSPIVPEPEFGTGSGTLNNNTSGAQRKILTDFQPQFDIGETSLSTVYFQYNANPYRLIGLSSDQPLNSLDFDIFWTNPRGEYIPLPISPGQSYQVKFLFIKKGLTN